MIRQQHQRKLFVYSVPLSCVLQKTIPEPELLVCGKHIFPVLSPTAVPRKPQSSPFGTRGAKVSLGDDPYSLLGTTFLSGSSGPTPALSKQSATFFLSPTVCSRRARKQPSPYIVDPEVKKRLNFSHRKPLQIQTRDGKRTPLATLMMNQGNQLVEEAPYFCCGDKKVTALGKRIATKKKPSKADWFSDLCVIYRVSALCAGAKTRRCCSSATACRPQRTKEASSGRGKRRVQSASQKPSPGQRRVSQKQRSREGPLRIRGTSVGIRTGQTTAEPEAKTQEKSSRRKRVRVVVKGGPVNVHAKFIR